MDTPLDIDFESDEDNYSDSDDDDNALSESESNSFDSDFDPEALKSHKRIETPRPSLTELQSILSGLNLDDEFQIEELKNEMKKEQNGKRKSISKNDQKDVETEEESKENELKHTTSVNATKIGKKWYINQYLCYDFLGKGSYGKVCLAKDITKNEKVAIKVINKSILKRKHILRKGKAPSNALENIFREIAIMKKLHHANVLSIHEVIDDPSNDKLYMIVDYMDGGSVLGEQGAEAKCEPIKDYESIRKYVRHMILGLDYLQLCFVQIFIFSLFPNVSKLFLFSSNDIIHGDIKPENLLLSKDGLLKIADFGVSFILDSETCPNNDGRIGRSQGTPAFTAPETGNKSFSAYPIDVWAMGVSVYMMITGICPFVAENIYKTYDKIKTYHPPIPDDLSDEMKDFMQRILEKDPLKRINLKEAMVHEWITKNGTEPLGDGGDTMLEVTKEKRVSVTKEDIEYAVSLPNKTIKHLRKMSNEIANNNKKKTNENIGNKSRGSKKKESTKKKKTPTKMKRKSSPMIEKNKKIKKSKAKSEKIKIKTKNVINESVDSPVETKNISPSFAKRRSKSKEDVNKKSKKKSKKQKDTGSKGKKRKSNKVKNVKK